MGRVYIPCWPLAAVGAGGWVGRRAAESGAILGARRRIKPQYSFVLRDERRAMTRGVVPEGARCSAPSER